VTVAALGVAFGFVVRQSATSHLHVPRHRLLRASTKVFRALLILAGVLMVVAFTEPLPDLSRVLVSLVVAVAGVSVGWFVAPVLHDAHRRRANLKRAQDLH
jgi:membrane associated rhomboid family serine protease